MADDKDTHDPEDGHVDTTSLTAAVMLRRIARWATDSAALLEDPETDDALRDVLIDKAHAMARVDLDRASRETETSTAKFRCFLQAVAKGAAAAVGASPDRTISPSLQTEDHHLASRLPRIVEYVLKQFALDYPEDAALVDRTALAEAVLGFRDETRDSKLGKDKAIAKAIERTSFGRRTLDQIRTERARVRANR